MHAGGCAKNFTSGAMESGTALKEKTKCFVVSRLLPSCSLIFIIFIISIILLLLIIFIISIFFFNFLNFFLLIIINITVFSYLFIVIIVFIRIIDTKINKENNYNFDLIYIILFFLLILLSSPWQECQWNQFQCEDESCVDFAVVCDGTKDCPRGFDELPGNCGQLCPSGTLFVVVDLLLELYPLWLTYFWNCIRCG